MAALRARPPSPVLCMRREQLRAIPETCLFFERNRRGDARILGDEAAATTGEAIRQGRWDVSGVSVFVVSVAAICELIW